MKRRNYLICSIIAMLSIVSYACETEYAICEGCGGTGGDENESSENACRSNMQKCAENLNGKQVCKDDKWGNIGECMSCYNKNTDNSGTDSLICNGCTPNSYNKSGTEVCYKGDFKKFESKSDSNPNSDIVINSNPKSDNAPWEFAYNNSNSSKYYNCHNDNVLNSMQPDSGGGTVGRIESCCEENDYYIKHIGYEYYSIEKCVKVEEEGILAGFMAYEYTDELNNMLIGKEDDLPYSFCHGGSILAVNNDFSQAGSMMYQKRMCPEGYSCAFNGICLSNSFKISDSTEGDEFFVCESESGGVNISAVVIKREGDHKKVAECPPNMVLKQNTNGKWKDVSCKANQKFRIDEVRCAPSRELVDQPHRPAM